MSLRLVVGEAEAGQRTDQALSALAGVPRAQARRWLDEGRVQLDGKPARASRRVEPGAVLEADPPEPVASEVAPEPIALDVLHEDPDLIVVDKPPGLVVHPAPGHPAGTLVNALLHHCRDLSGIGGVLRPGIVHRLDRGTSGVMVAAKNDESHAALSQQFADHSIERVYRALVVGTPGADAGRVDRAIGRHPRDRKKMSVRTRSGREAHTAWAMLRRFPRAGLSWLEVRPETGRTHQIRVHLSSTGLPIFGDPTYGRGARRARGRGLSFDRPALHAAVLGFTHPRSGERLRYEAPEPADLAALLERIERAEP